MSQSVCAGPKGATLGRPVLWRGVHAATFHRLEPRSNRGAQLGSAQAADAQPVRIQPSVHNNAPPFAVARYVVSVVLTASSLRRLRYGVVVTSSLAALRR